MCVCVRFTLFLGKKKHSLRQFFWENKNMWIIFFTTFTLVYGDKFTFLGSGLFSGEWAVENTIFITFYEGTFIFRISGFFSGWVCGLQTFLSKKINNLFFFWNSGKKNKSRPKRVCVCVYPPNFSAEKKYGTFAPSWPKNKTRKWLNVDRYLSLPQGSTANLTARHEVPSMRVGRDTKVSSIFFSFQDIWNTILTYSSIYIPK